MNKSVKENIRDIMEITIRKGDIDEKQYIIMYKDSKISELYKLVQLGKYIPKTPRFELVNKIEGLYDIIDYINTVLFPNDVNPIRKGLVGSILEFLSMEGVEITHMRMLDRDDIVYSARLYKDVYIDLIKLNLNKELELKFFNPDMLYRRYKICLFDKKTKRVTQEVYDPKYGYITLSGYKDTGVEYKHLDTLNNSLIYKNIPLLSRRIRKDKNIVILGRYIILYMCPCEK